jgi:hypothetical protein
MQHVERSPVNDIYVRLPHRLLDPVPDDVRKRLHDFYAHTFWCNVALFRCNQAVRRSIASVVELSCELFDADCGRAAVGWGMRRKP